VKKKQKQCSNCRHFGREPLKEFPAHMAADAEGRDPTQYRWCLQGAEIDGGPVTICTAWGSCDGFEARA
jgi:hypothetical protein